MSDVLTDEIVECLKTIINRSKEYERNIALDEAVEAVDVHGIVVAVEELLDKQDGWSNYQLMKVGDAVRAVLDEKIKAIEALKDK